MQEFILFELFLILSRDARSPEPYADLALATRAFIAALANEISVFGLLFERGIQVSMCGDLLNVFLQESFPSQSLVLGYVNEFVCQQP